MLSILLYKLCYKLLGILQYLLWKVNGVGSAVKRAKTPEGYGSSARIWNIIWKKKMDALGLTERENFMCTHDRFVHPEYVMKDNVSLYAIDTEVATFVETPLEIEIYKSDTNAFFFVGQFEHAVRVITMPLKSFYRLADDIGPPKSKVILLSSTGRCGSTLLTQMFESVPGVLSLAEPDTLCNIIMLKSTMKPEEYEKLTTASIHVLCKPLSIPQKYTIIKTRSACFQQVELLNKLFPEMVQLFLYRNCWKTLMSYHKMFQSGGGLNMISFAFFCQRSYLINRLLPNWSNFLLDIFTSEPIAKRYPFIKSTDFKVHMTFPQLYAVHWGSICALYNIFKEDNIDIAGIRYEDVLKEPEKTCRLLFERCGIPTKYVEEACKAIGKDSQRGSVLSQDALGNIEALELTDENRRDIDYVLTRLGLPSVGDDTIFPDTLGH